MFYQPLTDLLYPDKAVASSGRQTLRFRLKQENGVRLEVANLKVRLTTNGSALTGAAWGGLAGIVQEVRVVATDVLGKRNVVKMSGIALLMFAQQNLLNLDGETQIAYANAVSYPISTTVEITYPIFLRHPAFADPFGNQLSLPMSSNFVRDDAWIEVDLFDITAGTDVFTTNSPAFAATEPVMIEANYREVPESVAYIPSELSSDTAGFATTSKVSFELPAGGFLTQLGIQGLSADFDDTATRQALVAAGNQYKIDINRKNLVTTNQQFIQARNDRSRVSYPRSVSAVIASSFLHNRMMTGEAFFDFITDVHGFDVFSVASAVNLDPSVTGGYKLKVSFNDLANAAYKAHFHYHKILPVKLEDINALGVGV